MADDWWRQYQSSDPDPWDPAKWAEQAIAEAEAIVREAPAEQAEAAIPDPDAARAPEAAPAPHSATRTYTRLDGTRITEPIPPVAPVDPVRGLRLYIRRLREKAGLEEPTP
jgi:hypothetical protein